MKVNDITLSKRLNEHIQNYKSKINELFNNLNTNEFERVIETIIQAFQDDKKIFIAGNGGSAATASHFHEDFVFYSRHFAKKRPNVISLTNNVPYITAISNDIGYEEVFTEQMRNIFNEGDILIVISASGNSYNLIKAVEFVKNKRGISIAFVGFDGGKLKDICDHCIYTPNPKGEYGPIEDMHLILGHILISFFSIDNTFLSISCK